MLENLWVLRFPKHKHARNSGCLDVHGGQTARSLGALWCMTRENAGKVSFFRLMQHKHVGNFRMFKFMTRKCWKLVDFEACVAKSRNLHYKLVQPTEHGISACQSNATKMLFGLMYVVLVLVCP